MENHKEVKPVQDEEVSVLDDKVMKENKELVLRCKEFDIKLKTKESHCANLQLKATEDGELLFQENI